MHTADLVTGLGAIIAGIRTLAKSRPVAVGNGNKNREIASVEGPLDTNNEPVVKTHVVRDIEARTGHVAAMIRKGREHPRVRKVAAQILAKRCGDKWCVPEKDWKAEVRAIFDAVRSRVRYTRDFVHKDLYQHPLRTLEWGVGDCLPEDTLLLTRDGFVPIEHVVAGDEIHDGERWTAVVQTWDRGLKDIVRLTLNNGSVARVSTTHKMLNVPLCDGAAGAYDAAVEVLAGNIVTGTDLLQPRTFAGVDCQDLTDSEAFLIGAYLAAGCGIYKNSATRAVCEISIAGVPRGKGIRERVINILEARGTRHHQYSREVRFDAREFPCLFDLGRIALEKHLPTFRFSTSTVATIVQAMNMGDGGVATSGKSFVYSTISPLLALQYRVLNRMLGQSTHVAMVTDHGGFGTHPVYRITVRSNDRLRAWARVRSVELEDDPAQCYDLTTESGRIYLPAADVIVRNCDDQTIVLASLLQSVGYPIRLRVIRTHDSNDWNHIYLLVGLPPRDPRRWLPLDASVDQPAGWEAPASMIAERRDFTV